MSKVSLSKQLKCNKGLATVEGVVLLIVFVIVMTYALGFFGIVHSGIKNSIAARSLTFETFRNRSNLTYRRDFLAGPPYDSYRERGHRTHAIISEKTPSASAGSDVLFMATARQIAFVRNPDNSRSNIEDNNVSPQRETKEASPVFVKTKYGICLNARCGE